MLTFLIGIIGCGDDSAIDNSRNFKCSPELFGSDNELVVVLFDTEWNSAGELLTPILETTTADFPNIVFLKVDADEFPDQTASCFVLSVPTLVAFKDGEVVGMVIGAGSQTDVERLFKKLSDP